MQCDCSAVFYNFVVYYKFYLSACCEREYCRAEESKDFLHKYYVFVIITLMGEEQGLLLARYYLMMFSLFRADFCQQLVCFHL